MSFVKWTGGGLCLHSDYQMSNALSHKQIIVEDKYDWQREFWERATRHRGIETPMPCIYKKGLYFTGGFQPPDMPMATGETIYIADFECNHILVDRNLIRLPNDDEYKKYYKRLIDNYVYRIKQKHSGWGTAILIRNMTPVKR